MLDGMKRRAKEHFKDVATLKRSSRSLAFGFALGTFISVAPTFGLAPLIGILLVLIFKRISKLALFASFLIWNPFVLLFIIYPAGLGIGNVILSESSPTYNVGILNQVFAYSQMFLLGSIILALIASVISYFVVFLLIESYKKRRALRRARLENGKRHREFLF